MRVKAALREEAGDGMGGAVALVVGEGLADILPVQIALAPVGVALKALPRGVPETLAEGEKMEVGQGMGGGDWLGERVVRAVTVTVG